ncbi:MAG: hypothetical protein HDR43_02265 [Mycoplasma sp.]|nr:hypothetical protein [Mycoplasma sp.]
MKKIKNILLTSSLLISVPLLMNTISCNSSNTFNSDPETPTNPEPDQPTIPPVDSENPDNAINPDPETPKPDPEAPETPKPDPEPENPEMFENEDVFHAALIDRYFKKYNLSYVRDERVDIIALNDSKYRVTLINSDNSSSEIDIFISEEIKKELFPDGYKITE